MTGMPNLNTASHALTDHPSHSTTSMYGDMEIYQHQMSPEAGVLDSFRKGPFQTWAKTASHMSFSLILFFRSEKSVAKLFEKRN